MGRNQVGKHGSGHFCRERTVAGRIFGLRRTIRLGSATQMASLVLGLAVDVRLFERLPGLRSGLEPAEWGNHGGFCNHGPVETLQPLAILAELAFPS